MNASASGALDKKAIKLHSALLRSGLVDRVDLDMRLVPGLPGILFLGLPDTSLKETAIRLRSALRASGYEIPRGRQLLVDISPRDEKKAAHGFDLAVCIGLLILSGQIRRSNWAEKLIYGDVRLNGEVMAPHDWLKASLLSKHEMVTGPIGARVSENPVAVITHIRELQNSEPTRSVVKVNSAKREQSDSRLPGWIDDLKFSKEVSRLASIMAVGGHATLLAGSPGSGKSTLARTVHFLRPEPEAELYREILLWSEKNTFRNDPDDQCILKSEREVLRPLMEPHHSASEIAMVGGGRPIRPGIVTRAHGGTLLMDEVLLFSPNVQEALREPLESGNVQIARGSEWQKLPARFQLIGTTNLCACGRYTPSNPDHCRCSSRVRAKFEERLKGPFVDRFQIVSFTNHWRAQPSTVTASEIRQQIKKAYAFRLERQQDFENSFWRPIEKEFQNLLKGIRQTFFSERRRLSLVRVARTIADLEENCEIQEIHLREAVRYAIDPFVALYSGSSEPF